MKLRYDGAVIWGVLGIVALAGAECSGATSIDLAGSWSIKLDPQDVGVQQAWFNDRWDAAVTLPGSLQEQGYGDVPSISTKWMAQTGVKRTGYPDYFTHPMYAKYRANETFRFPYWLQPKRHYVGAAWYQRTVTVPADWADKHITLTLERCHWESQVWIDDRPAGSNDAIGTPHLIDLTELLKPGTQQTLTIRVDNRMVVNIGINAHSIGDQTQSAWNGIVGQIKLDAQPPVWIEDVQVYPDIERHSANVTVVVGNTTGDAVRGKLSVWATGPKGVRTDPIELAYRAEHAEKTVQTRINLGDQVLLWDEFTPNLYTLSVSLDGGEATEVCFGMREIEAKRTQFYINGKPVFLRGTLDCCIFPLTGYPLTDIPSWRKVMKRAREYGLNHIRFHSWCPPDAAFTAADLEGVYLQPEVSEWAGIRTDAQYAFLLRESKRMLRQYGNHPSFVMLAMGNESHCPKKFMQPILTQWKKDPRRVYMGKCNSNGSVIDQYDYYVGRSWGTLGKKFRIRYQMGWPPTPRNSLFTSRPPQTVIDWRDGIAPAERPFIAHETVQRCSYPDPAWQKKYTGSFRAAYLDIADDQLEERGMRDLVPEFVKHSGIWQVQQFKEEIEAALRTPGMAGFQLLDLHDFPGQGAALVGVLDAFWDDKGYVTGKQFRRFCSPTVPLARMAQRTWTTAETFVADIEVTHFGPKRLRNAQVDIKVVDGDGRTVHRQQTTRDLPRGSALPIDRVQLHLARLAAPAKYSLVVRVDDAENDWDFWVYPAKLPATEVGDVIITRTLDDATIGKLRAGATVLWLPARERIQGGIPQCFSSIYWNAPYTNGGESHTMGLICDPKHPLFARFPTDSTVNWNWYELLITARPMILDQWHAEHGWPKDYRPLIQPIDDWYQNRKLALLAEARVGSGELIVCSMDLETNLAERVVARQFRASLLSYMNSDAFAPVPRISIEQLQGLVTGIPPAVADGRVWRVPREKNR